MKNILRALLIAAAALTAASVFNHPSASVLDNGTMLAFGTPLPLCPPACPAASCPQTRHKARFRRAAPAAPAGVPGPLSAGLRPVGPSGFHREGQAEKI